MHDQLVQTLEPVAPSPWDVELTVVKDGAYSDTERRSAARDAESGRVVRLRRGVYADRAVFASLRPEDQHLVRMRALAAVASEPPVFSHWSAAVLFGMPVLSSRLVRVHTTVDERRSRGQDGVSAHLFPVQAEELVPVRGLLLTAAARTVIDVAGGGPFSEGVMAADGALRLGLPRHALEEATDAAGSRRALGRIEDVISFAHPGAESANESRSRVTMLRLGIEPPTLQHAIVVDGTAYFLDFFFRSFRAGGEADGAVKYLDPALGGRALLAEKRREDLVRSQLSGLARWGWSESGSPQLLRPVLSRAGVRPAEPRPNLTDYAVAARSALPRSHRAILRD